MIAILSALESILQWTFFSVLVPLGDYPWMIFSLLIAFGLGYWLVWQKRYDAIVENDPNQIR